MFLKLTENETMTDIYVNPTHIVRFLPDPASDGTLLFMSADAGVSEKDEPQIITVHEPAEEVYRIISRNEHRTASAGKSGASRGLI